jgi:uncharacterized protein (TIGR02271 family)
MMSHDARDTNHDGKVSFMEKVKDKLHLHHKDKDADYTNATTGHSSALPTSTTSHSTGIDLNHDGRISTSEKLATGSGLGVGSGLAGSGLATSSSGFHDSRDLNRDGYISTSEKLATSSSGFHDSRDLNRDGHISTSEKLGLEHHIGAAGAQNEAHLRLHEEQLAVSKRETLAGEVDIHKRVHQEHVQETVAVKHEEVSIERRPLSGIAEPGARIAAQDEVVRMPLYREEIVAEKRVVPTEEVIVRKNEVVENQTVGATLRSEFVETRQHNEGVLDARHHATGTFDARDTNLDGHVSMGEKLKGGLAHNKTGALDARDTNRDGHVSMGEKLKSADMRDSAFDARDRNLDGHVSAGEKLRG